MYISPQSCLISIDSFPFRRLYLNVYHRFLKMINTWYSMEIGLLKTALCSKTCLHFCNTKDFEGILGLGYALGTCWPRWKCMVSNLHDEELCVLWAEVARDFMHLFLLRTIKVRCPFTPVYESMKNRETMIYFRTVCPLRADVCAFWQKNKQTKNKSAVNSVRAKCLFNPVASSPFREQTIIDP